MSPITSFTASLGHNGLIDVFAVSNFNTVDSAVWRTRQKTPGGNWSAWVNEGKPGRGAGWVQSVLDADKHGHVLAVTDAAQLWFKERTPTDSFSAWKPLVGPPVKPAEIADPIPNDAWLFLSVWAGVHADGRIELAGTASDIGDSHEVFYRAPGRQHGLGNVVPAWRQRLRRRPRGRHRPGRRPGGRHPRQCLRDEGDRHAA